MLGHSEALILADGAEPELDQALLDGALLYLSFGPAPFSELVRVLAQHLETARRGPIQAGLRRLTEAGRLALSDTNLVSLPAGGDTRETEKITR